MSAARLKVGIVGYGLIGARRAAVADANPGTATAMVVDVSADRRDVAARAHGCPTFDTWQPVIADPTIDIVVIATPNGLSVPVAEAALEAGKHVLIEKPPGRTLADAERLAAAAARAKGVLKIGFNHRYHPAIAAAHQLVSSQDLGRIINVRARYGHGGRPGYEKEWRGNAELAGGGELLDQGVHIADLLCWFVGEPIEVAGMLQTAIWPISPLEDNAFALLRYSSGAVASLHTSWTQWKNMFSFEVFCERGSVSIEGLGGSYGVEKLHVHRRRLEGGAPQMHEQVFEGADESWAHEWDDLLAGIRTGACALGTAADGVSAMRLIDIIYRKGTREGP